MKVQNISMLALSIFSLVIAEQKSPTRPVSTYSIVAIDENTGELGVAVQSHWFSVGSMVPWAKAGVGAVATQSFVKVEYGPDGLELMESGLAASEALENLLAKDDGRAVRQVGMVDANGGVAAHTGSQCIEHAGNIIGKNYSVQANLMTKGTVLKAMAEAFENTDGDLADRMMAAMEAAEVEGGDMRGKQSASILIVSGQPTGVEWKDTVMNLRIEDHPTPILELRRLIRIHRAYYHVDMGDKYIGLNQIEKGLLEYAKAEQYYPENPELPYWSAIALVNAGRLNDALPVFKRVFKSNSDLREMTPRLFDSGLLDIDKRDLRKIMKQ